MKNKLKLASFLQTKIHESCKHSDEINYDEILYWIVEYEESKEDVDSLGDEK